MARYQHRNWIRAARAANRAHGLRLANVARDLTVGLRFATSDLEHGTPDAALKCRAAREIERRQSPQRTTSERDFERRDRYSMPPADAGGSVLPRARADPRIGPAAGRKIQASQTFSGVAGQEYSVAGWNRELNRFVLDFGIHGLSLAQG